MRIPIYQVDAFTSTVFAGNPAAVCLLDAWLPDEQLQGIGTENNLSETAFLVRKGDGFEIRWFTPATEIELCGHATLASAFVLFNCRDWSEDTVRLESREKGTLTVNKKGDLIELDFPARTAQPAKPPAGLCEALGVEPQSTLRSEEDMVVVVDAEQTVRGLAPDFGALSDVDCRGTIVTAKGNTVDFVSRFFAPRIAIPEDPVTGAAHCALTPYWAGVLGKNTLHALQVSPRGGELKCEHRGDRVLIAGKAVLYLEGTIT
ncbi:MAG: PhzF family phenazine biosynthesis protein, partial [Candidatus Latescibacterota bacterium]